MVAMQARKQWQRENGKSWNKSPQYYAMKRKREAGK